MKKLPELLAPAGNMEKLKAAVLYGADAVYVGGEAFNLRNQADNFTLEELARAVAYAHKHNVKIYVTLNIFPRNEHLDGMARFVRSVAFLGVDAFIVSDPASLLLVKENTPKTAIHISTQQNTTNWRSVRFWQDVGASRVILARELSIDEVRRIREKTDCELEVFIHGAMCVSYSGRCLLSAYMTGRNANLGKCTHPCRWKYFLSESTRPGEYFPVFENPDGTHILSSRDLCTIEHIDELIEAGVDSLKIEGRMKSFYYVASVTRVYRKALDEYARDPAKYSFNPAWLQELEKVSHRQYFPGFLFCDPSAESQTYRDVSYTATHSFCGVFKERLDDERALVEVRNKIVVGDEVEIMGFDLDKDSTSTIKDIRDEKGTRLTDANPNMLVTVTFGHIPPDLKEYWIMRKSDG